MNHTDFVLYNVFPLKVKFFRPPFAETGQIFSRRFPDFFHARMIFPGFVVEYTKKPDEKSTHFVIDRRAILW